MTPDGHPDQAQYTRANLISCRLLNPSRHRLPLLPDSKQQHFRRGESVRLGYLSWILLRDVADTEGLRRFAVDKSHLGSFDHPRKRIRGMRVHVLMLRRDLFD
jgi:hypothetical protein